MNLIAKASYIFFFLLHHMIFNLVDSKCHESFQCGNLGSLQFPFSDIQNPNCGLFMVDCNPSNPRIQLEDGGTWYDIIQKLSTNRFRVRDPILQSFFNRNCFASRNLSLPNSPYTSFTVAPNFTLFTCFAGSLDGYRLLSDYFRSQNYTNIYEDCSSVLFYPSAISSYYREIAIPQACSLVQLPLRSNTQGVFSLRLLTAVFDLEWTVSEDCVSCHGRGGQCQSNSLNEFQCIQEKGNWKFKKILLAVGVSFTAALIVISITLSIFLRKKWLKLLGLEKAKTENEKGIEFFLKNYGNLAPTRYRYKDLKKMTKSFSDKLGQGGYGSVYKGKLRDGCLVAVKILNESKGNGEEFINEVSSISKTSHVNIVNLMGFCFEGSKRALVYEFVPNGSLEKFICNANSSTAEGMLGWEKLFEIAVGIARGLEYLHQGCNIRILHFDIKPHNILLDKDLKPKISDFGLAKLCPNRSSIVSMPGARGTIGYIAPEVFCRNFGDVSHKSDVYSYGIMVLEMVLGRQNTVARADQSSEMYFPDWIYIKLEQNAAEKGVDSIALEEQEWQYVQKKLIIIGLWCIQTEPKNRPSISSVIEMLEGKLESLQVPPRPYLSSTPKSFQNFSTFESRTDSGL